MLKRLQDVARSYQVSVAIARFVQAQPHAVEERFASDLAFFIQNVDVGISEASVCEFLIAPVLKEVWRVVRWRLRPGPATFTMTG
jgi:hypothetical protein